MDSPDLQEQMGRLGHTALVAGERTDAIEHLVAGIARLGSEVKDASGYLPAYDQKTYGEVILSSFRSMAADLYPLTADRQSKVCVKNLTRLARALDQEHASPSRPFEKIPLPSPCPMQQNLLSRNDAVCQYIKPHPPNRPM